VSTERAYGFGDRDDEATGRTARLNMLEIRAETGERANLEVIRLKPTVKKLKYAIAVLGVLGLCVNFGYALFDKASHYATVERVEHVEVRQEIADRKADMVLEQMKSQKEMTSHMREEQQEQTKLLMQLLREERRRGDR
jgi:hypothetical protein